jgi:hypothetical protein
MWAFIGGIAGVTLAILCAMLFDEVFGAPDTVSYLLGAILGIFFAISGFIMGYSFDTIRRINKGL